MSGCGWIAVAALPALLVAATWSLGGACLRQGLGAERDRKLLHAVMALAASTLPLWDCGLGSVVAGGLLCMVWFAAVRAVPLLRARCGDLLVGVGRRSVGELAFAMAVILLFAATAGASLRFVVPLLVLGLADPAAALIGRGSTRRYRALGGEKSVAGTVTFAAVAAFVTLGALLAAGIAPQHAVVLSLAVSLASALAEAVAGLGMDNLTVPAAAYATLDLGLGAPELVVIGTTSVAALVLWVGRGTRTCPRAAPAPFARGMA